MVWRARKGLEDKRGYKQEPPVPPGDPDSDYTPVLHTPEILLRHPNWAGRARELGLALMGMLGGLVFYCRITGKAPSPKEARF